MRRFGVKRKSAGATKRLRRCKEWRPNSVRCQWWHRCAVLSSCWALGGLSVAVFGLVVVCQCPFLFHNERELKPLLCLISKAQPKNAAQTQCSNSVSSYSNLDYKVWSDVLHTTKFRQSLTLQLCNFVLLLTIWHLRIRVSLMFDNMNNLAWVHMEGLNPRLWKN